MTGLIIDLIVAVLIILLVLFGLWRGAYKLLFGLISSLLAIVLAVALVSSVTGLVVDKTTFDERIATSIDEAITSKLPNAGVAISYYDIDGVSSLGYMVDGEVLPFSSLLEGTSYSIFSTPLESVIAGQITVGEEIVFATVLVSTLVGYIMLLICFIVLLILLVIVIKIIMHIVRKFVTRTFFGHFVDKLLGAVLGIALAGIVVYGSLAIVKFMGTYEFIIPVNRLIQDSTITKFFFEKNFLYDVLLDSFNIKGIIDSIIASLGAVGG